MRLEDYKEVRFTSSFSVTALECKNLNLHRALFYVEGNGGDFTTRDFDTFRKELKLSFKRSAVAGFAFSMVLENFEVSLEVLESFVDNTNRRGGPCQWIIATYNDDRAPIGVHMWMEGKTSTVFEETLSDLSSKNQTPRARVKEPTGLMKLARFFGMPEYELPKELSQT